MGCWFTPVIPALKKRLENYLKVKAILVYTESSRFTTDSKTNKWTEEITQSLKSLLCAHEDLSFIPNPKVKSQMCPYALVISVLE